MNVQALIKECNELYANGASTDLIDAVGVAFVNAGDTVGPQGNIARVSEEFAECFIGTIRGMLCDPSCYGLTEEVIQWFAARGIKG